MTPAPSEVFDRILADMKAIWGEMAAAMLRKRMRDVQADAEHLTREQLVRVVQLLKEKTLPSVLGPEGAETKARAWMAWVGDGGAS